MTTSATSPTDLRELGTLYEVARGRIVALVEGLSDSDAATPVPACPEWSMHDVLAHLTGVCADIVVGNVQNAAADSWTAAQVEPRRHLAVDELLAEWDQVAPGVAAVADDFPGSFGRQFAADITVHEHDLRGALERPGFRDSAGVDLGIGFLMDVFFHPALCALGLGPLEVRAGDRTQVAGTGGPPTGDLATVWHEVLLRDDPFPGAGSRPVGVLTLVPFELFRALTGRRSAAQIRGYDWTVDPEPYLPAFAAGPFKLRSTDLE